MKFWPCLVFGLLLSPALATAEVYDCTVEDAPNDQFWLTGEYAFFHDTEEDTITINDGVIQRYHGGPIEGKIVGFDDKKLVLTWAINTTSTTCQRAKMTFRGSLFFTNDTFRVAAKPQGYRNSYEAYGHCKVQ